MKIAKCLINLKKDNFPLCKFVEFSFFLNIESFSLRMVDEQPGTY